MIRDFLTRTFAARPSGIYPGQRSFWNRWMLPGERDYRKDVGDGAGSSLVGPGIDYIADAFVEAPILLEQKTADGWTPVQSHPALDILEVPNKDYSGALLWMPTISNWISDGNAYWLPFTFTAAGEPLDFYFIPSFCMEPRPPKDGRGYVDHYEYRPGGFGAVMTEVDPKYVVHFRYGLDPMNPLKGYSRLKRVLREIYSDEEAARFTAALLRNFGIPGLMVFPKGQDAIAPDDAEQVKQELIQKTTGDRRGEPMVMYSESGVEQFGFSPADLDLTNLRAIPESRVAAALQIPAAVLGFLAGMTQTKVGATMLELREQAYESGVAPKQRLICSELRNQYLKFWTDSPQNYRFRHDLSDVRVLQEDRTKLTDRVNTMISGGWITVARGKEIVGEKPLPGDDVYLRPFNVEAIDPDQQIQPKAPAPAVPFPIGGNKAAASRFARVKKSTKQQRAYLKAADKIAQRSSAKFARELKKSFGSLGDLASAIWDQKPHTFASAEDQQLINSILLEMDLEGWTSRELEPLWRKYYQQIAEETFGAIRDTMVPGLALPDTLSRAIFEKGGRQLGLMDLDKQTREALFQALADAKERNLGPVETAREIRDFVSAGRFTGLEAERPGSGLRYRSELIARTETLNAQRIAVAETGREAGFEYFIAFDNLTGYDDEECIARDGQIFTYDEVLAESAAEHPNGTLGFAPATSSQIEVEVETARKPVKITHIDYDKDTGRIAQTREEVIHG